MVWWVVEWQWVVWARGSVPQPTRWFKEWRRDAGDACVDCAVSVICGAVKNMRVVVEPQAQTVANLPCWVRFAAEASFTKEAAAADRLTVAPMGFLRTGLTQANP